MVLSTREKALLVLLALVLAGTGVFYGLRSLAAHEQALALELRRQQETLREAEALRSEVARLERRPTAGVLERPLIGHVEELAGQIGLGERIQLNVLPEQALSGMQGVEIRLDRLTLDELVQLLHSVENSEPALVIDQMELAPSFREQDLLRVNMRVLARS